jgi:hypothetical protein
MVKKTLITAVLILLLTMPITGVESVLIDFNLLKANGVGYNPDKNLAIDAPEMLDYTDHDRANRYEHVPTMVDYSAMAGAGFDDADLVTMVISLACYNWDVKLNSSAASVGNRKYSKAIEWHTKYVSILGDPTTDKPEGYTILGLRIRYPEAPFNSYATVKPPFEIPAYEDIITDYQGNPITDELLLQQGRGKKFENGYGVVKNVGIIKRIDMRVFGCNFKNSMAILLKDDLSVEKEYHFEQYLDFDGWREISWKNPNYIEAVNNRDLYIIPLYPRNEPFVKLTGFRIYRPGDQLGGDFISYIKDVKITYDQAIVERPNNPIEHEEAWGILEDRAIVAKEREYRRVGQLQILRFLERQTMDKYTR